MYVYKYKYIHTYFKNDHYIPLGFKNVYNSVKLDQDLEYKIYSHKNLHTF